MLSARMIVAVNIVGDSELCLRKNVGVRIV